MKAVFQRLKNTEMKKLGFLPGSGGDATGGGGGVLRSSSSGC